jgi:DNA excision repair protein ERCC-3
MDYAVAPKRAKFRVASENPAKLPATADLVRKHAGEQILVIGMYVDQLKWLAGELGCPIILGSTAQAKRDELFAAFRAGEIRVLVVSKVANFAIDLPDASVAIQVSGTFGSRQEEAQRLGRILRPKGGANRAWFYSLVSEDTVEQDFALNRQMFLCEQGYDYQVIDPL